jgi:hypothetical protein
VKKIFKRMGQRQSNNDPPSYNTLETVTFVQQGLDSVPTLLWVRDEKNSRYFEATGPTLEHAAIQVILQAMGEFPTLELNSGHSPNESRLIWHLYEPSNPRVGYRLLSVERYQLGWKDTGRFKVSIRIPTFF